MLANRGLQLASPEGQCPSADTLRSRGMLSPAEDDPDGGMSLTEGHRYVDVDQPRKR